MFEILQIIAGLFLLFFLPGYTLVVALFPRKGELDKEYDMVYRISMGIVMSVVLVILTGFGLNSLGVYKTANGDYKGYVQTPFLVAAFLVQSAIFFFIGWYRGGYPIMGRIHPKLARHSRAEPGMVELPGDREKYLVQLEKLGTARERLKKEIRDYERRERLSTDKMREHYRKKAESSEKELEYVNGEIEMLEKKISSEQF
jgi:hypothetical protein